MIVNAKMVKEIRQRTNAGIMECKNALISTNGNIEKAIEKMRKLGQAKADKKSFRLAMEGVISIGKSNNKLTMIEVNSETDFVARDIYFKKFVQDITYRILNSDVLTVDKALQLKLDNGDSIDTARKNLIAIVGENINLRRIVSIKGNQIGFYNHNGRIGVLISMKSKDHELIKDIAMHIAASNPSVIFQHQFPKELIEKEKEIFTTQAQKDNKPKHIIEKIINGRIRKFLNEQSLVGQIFIKNSDYTIGEILKQKDAEVLSFIRFALGEGIEKHEVEFSKEVKHQINQI